MKSLITSKINGTNSVVNKYIRRMYSCGCTNSRWRKQELVTGADSYLFSGLKGFAVGAVSEYALKKIIKLAAIILGAFFLGLAYLSYKGWINANWNVIQNQTYSGVMNTTQAAQHYISIAMQHVSSHPALQGQGLRWVSFLV